MRPLVSEKIPDNVTAFWPSINLIPFTKNSHPLNTMGHEASKNKQIASLQDLTRNPPST
jgi:hypothetical protein